MTQDAAWDVLKVGGRPPLLPAGVRVYAISDIHGRADLLGDLLHKIRTDRALRPLIRPVVIFLGDYIDRGPSSCQTIDCLMTFAEEAECVFLKGNHEEIALRCLTETSLFDRWLRLGGGETLRSYGIDVQLSGPNSVPRMQAAFFDAISERHLRFFRNLENSFVCGDFFFAHAGVRPHVPFAEQKPADLLWIRDEFLSSPVDFGKIVVHGHTPTKAVDVRPNRINIDTGAFATDCLSCLVVEQGSLSVIQTASG